MGQHKTNPTAIKAKQGLIPPKKKNRYPTHKELQRLAANLMMGQILRGNQHEDK